MLKEFHRGGMPKDMGRNALLGQGRASLLGSCDVFGEEILHAVPAEPFLSSIWEQWIVGASASFRQPSA
jgi:hypothetical protein